jgi:hypothetical protein
MIKRKVKCIPSRKTDRYSVQRGLYVHYLGRRQDLLFLGRDSVSDLFGRIVNHFLNLLFEAVHILVFAHLLERLQRLGAQRSNRRLGLRAVEKETLHT